MRELNLKQRELSKIMQVRTALWTNSCGTELVRCAQKFGTQFVTDALNIGGGPQHDFAGWLSIYARYGLHCSVEELEELGAESVQKMKRLNLPLYKPRAKMKPRVPDKVKRAVLRDLLEGKMLVKDICAKYDISPSQFFNIKKRAGIGDLRGKGIHKRNGGKK